MSFLKIKRSLHSFSKRTSFSEANRKRQLIRVSRYLLLIFYLYFEGPWSARTSLSIQATISVITHTSEQRYFSSWDQKKVFSLLLPRGSKQKAEKNKLAFFVAGQHFQITNDTSGSNGKKTNKLRTGSWLRLHPSINNSSKSVVFECFKNCHRLTIKSWLEICNIF